MNTFAYRQFLTDGGTEYAAVSIQRVDRPGDPDRVPVITMEIFDGHTLASFDCTPIDEAAHGAAKELLRRLRRAIDAAEAEIDAARAGWEAESAGEAGVTVEVAP